MKTAEEKLNEKWTQHKLVQEAIEKAHNEPSPRTMEIIADQNKQLATLSTDIAVIKQRGIDRDDSIEEIKQLLEETNVTVNKIGSDILTLSNTNKNMENLIEKHDKALFDSKEGLIPLKDRIWGGVKLFMFAYTGLLALIATLFGFYIKDLKNTIADENAKMIQEQVPKAVQTALKDLDIDATIK